MKTLSQAETHKEGQKCTAEVRLVKDELSVQEF